LRPLFYGKKREKKRERKSPLHPEDDYSHHALVWCPAHQAWVELDAVLLLEAFVVFVVVFFFFFFFF
jgi:hypothetical protein